MRSTQPFEIKTRIDERGIVRVDLVGQISAEAWIACRREVIQNGTEDHLASGRPIIVDLRSVRFPPNRWIEQARKIAHFQATNDIPPPRSRALVVDNLTVHGAAIRLFHAVQSTFLTVPGLAEVFSDYDEAYAWISALAAATEAPD